MTEPRKRNPELERMLELENSRQAIRRSEELIAETKERLKKSGQLTERERQELPSWRP
jgi:transposase